MRASSVANVIAAMQCTVCALFAPGLCAGLPACQRARKHVGCDASAALSKALPAWHAPGAAASMQEHPCLEVRPPSAAVESTPNADLSPVDTYLWVRHCQLLYSVL